MDPTLAVRTLPAGVDGESVPTTLTVRGGLHQIRGNDRPYFTLTYERHRVGKPNQCYSGGAGHDLILRYYPQFADLAALHLSDPDGVPMHAEANGWYALAGALGGAGERFHAGNNERWIDGERRMLTPDECLQQFAEHCRIPMAEAEEIREAVRTAATTLPEPGWGEWERVDREPDWTIGRAKWRQRMEAMRLRWKAEATAAIERHRLTVFD